MKKTIVRIILVTLLGLAGATPVLADGGGEPARFAIRGLAL